VTVSTPAGSGSQRRSSKPPGSADRDTLDIIWASVERFSLSERANAVAQTKGVVPRRTQLTDIMGYSPTDADRMMSELTDDLILDQQYAIGLKAATGATTNVTNNNG
jgi:hypothetical protein